MSNENELLPCPFCGEVPAVYFGSNAEVSCRNRHCFGPRTPYFGNVDDAIAAWNRRAEPAPSSPVPVEADMMLVPKAAIDWLMGAGPDSSGHWFGEFPDGVQPRGAFWWRNNFRAMLPAAPAHMEVGE